MTELMLTDDPQTVEALRSMADLWQSPLLPWLKCRPQAERGRFLAAFVECSRDVQEVVLRMLTLMESCDATPAERQQALTTIAQALELNPVAEDHQPGMDSRATVIGGATDSPHIASEHAADETGRLEPQQALFARRLRELMDVKRLSQQELATRIGCTQPAISQMLNRRCRPQKKTILKLAEALNVSPRELWPDLEVVEMLDAVASFQEDDYTMTPAEAEALRDPLRRNPPKIPVRSLPRRR